MKFYVFFIVVLLSFTVVANAAYNYVIEDGDYFTSLTLNDYETLLMTGGGGDSLTLDDYSQATIQGTTPLAEFSGGIWTLRIHGNEDCYLDFSGGEIHEFITGYEARARFSGGWIDEIKNGQHVVDIPVGDPPVWVPNKHIEFIVRDYLWNPTTSYLSGTWNVDNDNNGQYDTFNIKLGRTSQMFDPAIDNIKFTIIPEPTSLLLFSLGGLLLRRKR